MVKARDRSPYRNERSSLPFGSERPQGEESGRAPLDGSRFLFIVPSILALKNEAMPIRNPLGHALSARRHVEGTRSASIARADTRPFHMPAYLPWGTRAMTRSPVLKPKCCLCRLRCRMGKPYLSVPHLASAAAFVRPDLNIGRKAGKGRWGAGADTQGVVVIVLLGKRVRGALHLGPTAGPAFSREPRGLQLVVEPPTGGVHHRRILQRSLNLALDPL